MRITPADPVTCAICLESIAPPETNISEIGANEPSALLWQHRQDGSRHTFDTISYSEVLQDASTRHLFHRACIVEAVRVQRDPSCPYCRERIPEVCVQGLLGNAGAMVRSYETLFRERTTLTQEERGRGLRAALHYNHHDRFLAFFESGPISDLDRDRAVQIAVERGNLAGLRRLLSRGAISVAARGRAVTRAAGRGFYEMVQALVENGDIFLSDRRLAIDFATSEDFPEIESLLRRNHNLALLGNRIYEVVRFFLPIRGRSYRQVHPYG